MQRTMFKATIGAIFVGLLFALPVAAERFESTNYIIDASEVGNSFGGTSESASYRLVSSGGEATIGNGMGGSYLLGQGYVAQLEQSLQISVQPSGLGAYYPMDENTGTSVHDNSPNNNDSTNHTTANWTAGKIGSALSFDGSSEVEIPDNSTLDFTSDIAIMGWVKPSSASQGAATIIGKTDGADANYRLGVAATSNEAVFEVSCTGSTTVTSTTAITDTAQWYHIAGVKDGTDLKIFVNGQLENTASCGSATATDNAQPLYLGADSNGNNYTGDIDEVKLFDRAFFDDEVTNEYDATNAGTSSALSFPELTPGTSQTIGADVVLQTDAPSYELAIEQNGDLTNGSDTIPGVSGTIASPAAWNEGTTKGLGFTLSGGNVSIPGAWGTSPNFNYAALPGTSTTFFTRSGFTGGTKDLLEMQYRLDVDTTQPAGEYQNTTTYTGTILP